jgi:hypothetical protein
LGPCYYLHVSTRTEDIPVPFHRYAVGLVRRSNTFNTHIKRATFGDLSCSSPAVHQPLPLSVRGFKTQRSEPEVESSVPVATVPATAADQNQNLSRMCNIKPEVESSALRSSPPRVPSRVLPPEVESSASRSSPGPNWQEANPRRKVPPQVSPLGKRFSRPVFSLQRWNQALRAPPLGQTGKRQIRGGRFLPRFPP